jgi:hypothetical protein
MNSESCLDIRLMVIFTAGIVLSSEVGNFGGLLADDLQFAKNVRPILSDACYSCHGPDEKSREGDLRLDDRGAVMKADVLTSGTLLARLTSDDPDVRMPPVDSNRRLPDKDRKQLIRWLNEGGQWPEDDQHWAFVAPQRPALPEVQNESWVRGGIDAFVLSRLERENWQPAIRADKATLLRRVTFDLTGLPPTIAELDSFIGDLSPQAYEKAVDRLLDSSRYGEHMALLWMEASRYADTDGYQNDRLRYMWVWRDWLIKALNDNQPFDQFAIEQMAGDLLPDRTFLTQVATGFNRNHRINSEGGSIPDEWIVEYVADRVETMGTVFLGLTLNCARCHDHKYDPISQKNFYRFFAFFNNIAEAGLGPNNGNSPPFIKVPKSWPNLSDEESRFVVPDPPVVKLQQTSVPRPQSGSNETVMVLHELEQPRKTYVLKRGQYDQPDQSERLRPATPTVLGTWREDWPVNRLGLAKWLTDPSHPLTARVTVNRMWQHFFGIGLVKTSENFGVQGELPSHPELLDWLATEFIGNDWDVKSMHRLIVTSATYRQDSSLSEKGKKLDPENRLLARGPRRRLSPYSIRDAALFSAGLLVEKVGGPSVKPYMPPGIWKSVSNAKYQQSKGDSLYRRSLYTYWRRTLPPPTMMAFNAAARETCVVRKDRTTTPLQALTMMNNRTFVEAARFLAERMMAKGKLNSSEKIAWAFRQVTSRFPTSQELEILTKDVMAYRRDFAGQDEVARKLLSIGEKQYNKKLNVGELAALTLIANTILNLDEAITKN